MRGYVARVLLAGEISCMDSCESKMITRAAQWRRIGVPQLSDRPYLKSMV